MAKAIDIQAVALEALAQAMADPAPKVLLGSAKAPGFFNGTRKPVKDAAKLCEERQWLLGTGEWIGKGASKKQTYRLSPAGIQAVLEQSESAALLRGLSKAMQEQVEVFRALQGQVTRTLSQLQPLTDMVQQLARKVEPPDVEAILRRLHGTNSQPLALPPSSSPPDLPDWLDNVVKLTAEQQQRDRYQPLSLPAIFATLRQMRPTLTLGQFHDGLRLLREQKRIRLSPYTRALATIEDARNALFLDGEVMYYVELP
ncbi:MAG: hypothetical protein K2R98_30135 [Gemmataceae bacterium]|nr:hypothetical protein [Gemmataceae bacterium]